MLHYQTVECPTSEEWIVFVHGAGGSSNVWYRQIRQFGNSYNLLLLDLRGHGMSAMQNRPMMQDGKPKNYTFRSLAEDVIEVLDHLKLKNCHFIALSIGTIIVREIVEIDKTYIKSMIMAGAILRLGLRTRILSGMVDVVKRYIPYMTLYKAYAYIIMPRPAHRKSRMLFISNAIKITNNEFLNWLSLNRGLNRVMDIYCSHEPEIPTLYLMGENDYVFITQVRTQLQDSRYSVLHIIPKAGHVCNIDCHESFNSICLSYLRNMNDVVAARQSMY